MISINQLQNETKCHNINFVTPEHVSPQVVEAIAMAAEEGLRVPIVYNTSSYDSMKSLELMDGLVDIYMPDFKFWTRETSQRLCKARDYPDVARLVIKVRVEHAMHAVTWHLCSMSKIAETLRRADICRNTTEQGGFPFKCFLLALYFIAKIHF